MPLNHYHPLPNPGALRLAAKWIKKIDAMRNPLKRRPNPAYHDAYAAFLLSEVAHAYAHREDPYDPEAKPCQSRIARTLEAYDIAAAGLRAREYYRHFIRHPDGPRNAWRYAELPPPSTTTH